MNLAFNYIVNMMHFKSTITLNKKLSCGIQTYFKADVTAIQNHFLWYLIDTMAIKVQMPVLHKNMVEFDPITCTVKPRIRCSVTL